VANSALPSSIAVLPFEDYSEKADQQYFSRGIAEEILNLLAQTQGLRVAARTSSLLLPEATRTSVHRRKC
jgi:TolB-like protein